MAKNDIIPINIDIEDLKSQLHYDFETGIFTRKSTGKKLTTCNTKGYIQIKINRKTYQAHRLAWFYVHGQMPLTFVDHINGKRNDNRIENIRLCNKNQNGVNSGLTSRNTSGYKGVCWHKKKERWIAASKLNGKLIHIGTFIKKEDAIASYVNFCKINHGEFLHSSLLDIS